jgi:hypothetical protein
MDDSIFINSNHSLRTLYLLVFRVLLLIPCLHR